MNDYWTNLRQKIRYNNWIRLIHDGLVRIGIKISPFYLVEEGGSASNPPFELAASTDYSVGFLGEADMKEIAAIPLRKLSEQNLLDRIKNGCKCLGVKKNKKLVAFTWFNLKECPYQGFKFALSENEAYLFDAYTLREYRGNNIAPLMRYMSYRELEKIGRTRLYSISECINSQSIKFKKKLNARFVYLGVWISFFRKWDITIPIKKLKAH